MKPNEAKFINNMNNAKRWLSDRSSANVVICLEGNEQRKRLECQPLPSGQYEVVELPDTAQAKRLAVVGGYWYARQYVEEVLGNEAEARRAEELATYDQIRRMYLDEQRRGEVPANPN